VHGRKVVASNHAGGPFLCLSNDLFSGGEENDIIRVERSTDILEGDQRYDRFQGVEADALNWSDEVFA